MSVTLEEAKVYLRQDSADEDQLITGLISAAEELVRGVSRLDDEAFSKQSDVTKVAVLYAVSYLYEHREEADHHELTLTLRSLLFGVREAKF